MNKNHASLSEVKAAIAKIKTRKAPGIEGELIKGGGQTVLLIVHKMQQDLEHW